MISKELPVGIRQVLNMRRLVGVYDWVGLCLCVPVLRLRCCLAFQLFLEVRGLGAGRVQVNPREVDTLTS
jgi:hypothetical protein